MARDADWQNRCTKGGIFPSAQGGSEGCLLLFAATIFGHAPKASCINGRLAWPIKYIARLLKRGG